MSSFLTDLRHGIRQLIQRPAFSAAAIASLALGIGLNTTLFSVVNAVLFKGTMIAAPDRLVEIYTGLNKDFPQLTTSYLDYLDIRKNADALKGFAASGYVRGILSGGDRPALVTGEVVSSDYFDTLGVPLAAGRPIRDDENVVANATPVVVLSHGLWQRQFGGRPDMIGRNLQLSGISYTVVGIAPAGFKGTIPGIASEFFAPITMVDRLNFSGVQTSADEDPGKTRLERRGQRWLFLKGRLAEGRTLEEARAQIDTIFRRLNAEYPITNDKVTSSVVPAASIRFHPMLDGYVKAAGAGLLTAVGLVMLIACANVANMLLARGASRRREIAIRTAIGASRSRIIRQLLTEGVVLAAAGGGLGVLLAIWGGRALMAVGIGALPIPISFDFSIDRNVLAFAVIVSAATALLFGLAPALSASKPELVPALKESAEGDGRRRITVRDALVVGQLSLSLVLLVAGALLTRGLMTARAADLGFDPRPISSLSFNLQMNGYELDRATAFRERALQTLRSLPGVVAVSTASRLPLAPDINISTILITGRHTAGDDGFQVDTVKVGADYFASVGVAIVAGRAFTEEEVKADRHVAIVNETLAREFWPDGSAVGRQVYEGSFNSQPYEIIGVSRDHKVRSVGEAPRPYLQLPDAPSRTIGLVVRTQLPAEQALPTLRQALRALEPNLQFTDDTSAEEVAATTVAPTRIGAMALGAFGALALVLAAVGLYGVMAYSVSRRTREVAIRMALGAERRQVLAMLLGHGGRLACTGIAIGAFGAAVAGRFLRSLIYGVSGFDPIAYGTAALVLMLVALAANLVPALAATRIEPVRALRDE
jgi:putative ABC transport system permease protein